MMLHIKNMLSSRCIKIVLQELHNLGFDGHCVELGTVSITGKMNHKNWKLLEKQLLSTGLELMEDKKTVTSDKIKYFVADILGSSAVYSEMNISAFLTSKMNMNYPALAKAFSKQNNTSLKQYIISERVKKVKELILYRQDNLAAISSKLNYSSTAHLCNEFKKITGFTPKTFRHNFIRSAITVYK